jgi:hypothetical protein
MYDIRIFNHIYIFIYMYIYKSIQAFERAIAINPVLAKGALQKHLQQCIDAQSHLNRTGNSGSSSSRGANNDNNDHSRNNSFGSNYGSITSLGSGDSGRDIYAYLYTFTYICASIYVYIYIYVYLCLYMYI